jgi:hypothetical protein
MRQVSAASARKINEDDANDERGFDTFAQRDEESREHEFSSCK